MQLDKIQALLSNTGIVVSELIDNNKASEKYIRVKFVQDDGFTWDTVVPYEYRRSGLQLSSEEEKLIIYRASSIASKRKKWKSGE